MAILELPSPGLAARRASGAVGARVAQAADATRERLRDEVFAKVAGPEGPRRRQRIATEGGGRWFADDRPIRRVHADASMFAGGLRALLLQSLHPLAMTAVQQHSRFRDDPWGRLQQTSYFIAVTTFGPADDADRAVARVRAVHERVSGIAADGRPYRASDPHLLEWVHIAEVDSFLRAHQRYGERALDPPEADGYVADMARIATALGVIDPPTTVAELDDRLNAYRPELAGTDEARAAARFLLLHPPLPLPVRPAYGVLAAAAVSLMPRWTRWPLRLPYLPLAEATAARPGGQALTAALRWVMAGP